MCIGLYKTNYVQVLEKNIYIEKLDLNVLFSKKIKLKKWLIGYITKVLKIVTCEWKPSDFNFLYFGDSQIFANGFFPL